MNDVFPLLVGVLGLGYAALFAAAGLSHARSLRAKSRADLLVTGFNGALGLVLLHEFFSWWAIPAALWLVPVAIFAAGVAGTIIAWPTMTWTRKGRSVARTIVFAALNAVIVAAVIVLVFS